MVCNPWLDRHAILLPNHRMAIIVAVTAHPDDEVFTFGGALAIYAARGHDVGLICLTDGEMGRTGGLVERSGLAALRREELRRACAHFEIGAIITPGLPDGGLDKHPQDAGVELVAAELDRLGADVVLAFGPEGGASAHPDHKAASRWATRAAADRRLFWASWPGELQMPVKRPREPGPSCTTLIELGDRAACKRAAFLEHRTQIDHLALFDRLQENLGGRELYHRVHPAWRGGGDPETELLEL